MPFLELGVDRSHSHLAKSSLSIANTTPFLYRVKQRTAQFSPEMAKMLPAKTRLGEVLEAARQRGVDPVTGDSWAQTGVSRALQEKFKDNDDELDIDVPERTYASIENETKLVKPKIINALADILPISVLEMVRAMGFSVSFEGIQDEEEVALLEAFRQASGPERRAARAALGLPPERPPTEHGKSLRHLVARDRRDRRGTPG